MSSFGSVPTADVATTGWGRTGTGSFYETVDEGVPGSDVDVISGQDDTASIVFSGSAVPENFPANGATSVDYDIRLRKATAKVTPTFAIEALDSANNIIATMTGVDIDSVSFVDFSGTLSITGTNTLTSWTGHRIRINPDPDALQPTQHTSVVVASVELQVHYNAAPIPPDIPQEGSPFLLFVPP